MTKKKILTLKNLFSPSLERLTITCCKLSAVKVFPVLVVIPAAICTPNQVQDMSSDPKSNHSRRIAQPTCYIFWIICTGINFCRFEICCALSQATCSDTFGRKRKALRKSGLWVLRSNRRPNPARSILLNIPTLDILQIITLNSCSFLQIKKKFQLKNTLNNPILDKQYSSTRLPLKDLKLCF